jgi:hypothetical protein
MLLWLKHPEFNWMYHRMGLTSDEQPGGQLSLCDVPDGTWSAQWLNTVEARPAGQEMVTAKRRKNSSTSAFAMSMEHRGLATPRTWTHGRAARNANDQDRGII